MVAAGSVVTPNCGEDVVDASAVLRSGIVSVVDQYVAAPSRIGLGVIVIYQRMVRTLVLTVKVEARAVVALGCVCFETALVVWVGFDRVLTLVVVEVG